LAFPGAPSLKGRAPLLSVGWLRACELIISSTITQAPSGHLTYAIHLVLNPDAFGCGAGYKQELATLE
jgi:hypothetical protein